MGFATSPGPADVGERRALGRDEGPVRLVRRALLDPALEDRDVARAEGLVRLGRRHDRLGIARRDAPDERASPGVPLDDHRLAVGPRSEGEFGPIQAQLRFPRARIGSMAAEAVGDEDRTDVLVEGDGVREARHGHRRRGRRGRRSRPCARTRMVPPPRRRGPPAAPTRAAGPASLSWRAAKDSRPGGGGARISRRDAQVLPCLAQSSQTWCRHPGAADIQPFQARKPLQRRKARVGHRGAVETERLEVSERGERLHAGVAHGRPAQVETFEVRHLRQHLQARVGDRRSARGRARSDGCLPPPASRARHHRRPFRRPPPCTRGRALQAGSPAAIREPPPARPRAWSRTRRPGAAEAPRPPAAPPPEGVLENATRISAGAFNVRSVPAAGAPASTHQVSTADSSSLRGGRPFGGMCFLSSRGRCSTLQELALSGSSRDHDGPRQTASQDCRHACPASARL